MQVADLVDGVAGALRSRPRGPAAQEVEQDAGVDRLAEAGQGADGGGRGPDLLRGLPGGDQEVGLRAVAAQPAEQLQPVLAGDGGVGDDEVGDVGRGEREGGRDVGGLADLPPAEAEEAGDAAAGEGVGVDDEGGQHVVTVVVVVAALVQPYWVCVVTVIETGTLVPG
nr:hypothetical protein [Blastococcus sp. TML/C7B]